MPAKEKKKEKAKVAFHTQISMDEDHQKYSLDAQKERLEAFCKNQYGDGDVRLSASCLFYFI